MRRVAFALLATSFGLFAASPALPAPTIPPLVCTSGSAIASVDLRVASPSPRNTTPLPLKTINRIEEGDTIRYRPLLRPHEVRKGDVTLVLIPANKKTAGKPLLIFDPKPADKPEQWMAPWRVGLIAFVYGPSGLNVKKVKAFLDRDDELVGELADYAEKTEKTEALISALSSSNTSSETIDAALQGFSSKFGAATALSRGAPTDQQATTLFRSLNPSIATYDPLASTSAQSVSQTAGLATLAGETFFASPIVDIATGGTALLLNLEALAFPRSEFRSALAQEMPADGVGLCGKTGADAAHTRIDYLWAVRVPNAESPRFTVGKANSLPITVKSPLPLTGPAADWKFLDRARNWMLVPDSGKATPVKVQVLANVKSIELDIEKNLKPGRYSLRANWDWDSFEVAGFFNARPLADFTSARPTPASQDALVADSGNVVMTLENSDFEFVTKVEIKKLNDEFASASALPFVLPKGLRDGVQDHMDVQVPTGGLEVGSYNLMVSQVDEKARNIPLRILPPLPEISNLPLSLGEDVRSVMFDLKGKRLDLLDRIVLAQGAAKLGKASADGTERRVSVQLSSAMNVGAKLSADFFVENRVEPVSVPDAITVVGPRPSITGVSMSQFSAPSVQLKTGELPGGLTLSALLHVEHFSAGEGVKLACEQSSAAGTFQLHPGQETGTPRVEQLTPDQLYLTFGTDVWFNGCVVDASITTPDGDSAPRRIARIVDLPSIDHFELNVDEGGAFHATIVGENLETIDKTGWSADAQTPVAGLPRPISDDGRKQKLEIAMPAPPASDALLYVSLRGEDHARSTAVHATPTPPAN